MHSCKSLDASLKQQMALSHLTPMDFPQVKGTRILSHVYPQVNTTSVEFNTYVCVCVTFNLGYVTLLTWGNEEIPFKDYFKAELKYYMENA